MLTGTPMAMAILSDVDSLPLGSPALSVGVDETAGDGMLMVDTSLAVMFAVLSYVCFTVGGLVTVLDL